MEHVITQFQYPEQKTTTLANVRVAWVHWVEYMYDFSDEAPEDFRSAFKERFDGQPFSDIQRVLVQEFIQNWKNRVRMEHRLWD